MQAALLWAVVSGFLVAVLVRSFVPLSWPVAAFLVLLAGITFALRSFNHRHAAALLICSVALCSFAGGIMRTNLAAQVGDAVLDRHVDQEITIIGTVTEEPDVRERSERLSVHASALVEAAGETVIDAGILVLVAPHSSLAYGDVVRATGELRLPEAFDTDGGRTFNYPLYLAKDGILYELAFAEAEPTGERHANPLKAAALGLKQRLLGGLRRALPEPEAGLAAGITVGDKRSVGEELSEVFVRSSLVHVLVLSGYNITLVLNAAAWMLGRVPRFARFGASGAVVTFFVLMTGGAATAVRASLMALLAVYARLTGRHFLALRALAAAALIMVLWNPLTLAFDPSFQLSALATLGLVLFTPPISERLQWLTARWGLREITASTIATQVAVLPLLLYQSGTLSLVALPANLLALSIVPAAMGFSAIAALAGLLGGVLAPILGLPAYVSLAYVIGVARFFASLPFAALSVPAFSAWWLVPVYAMLLSGCVYLHRKSAGAPGAPALSWVPSRSTSSEPEPMSGPATIPRSLPE